MKPSLETPAEAAGAARSPLAAARARTLLGIGLTALCYLLFATQDVFVKLLARDMSLVQIIFAMNILSLPLFLMLARREGGTAVLRVNRPGWQILRAALFIGTGFSLFFAFTQMPLADVYAIVFTAPLLITALSAVFLREPVGWRRWAAIVAGFVGVLIILRPGTGMFQPGAVWAIVGTLSLASNVVLIRATGATVGPAAMMGYNLVIGLLITGTLLPFGFFTWPEPVHLPWLIGAGLLAGIAQVCQIQGFRFAASAVVAPFLYTQMVWGLTYGYFIFGDLPDRWMIVGVLVVVASGLYVLWRETRKAA